MVARMRPDRVDALAEILTQYSIPIEKGQKVSIESTPVAEPLVLALYKRLLERGALVQLRPYLENAEPVFYEVAAGEQLDFIWDTDRWFMENLDARFHVLAESNTKRLSRA